MICNQCGCEEFYAEAKGQHVGLYCKKCGTWKKWADNQERIKYAPKQDSNAAFAMYDHKLKPGENEDEIRRKQDELKRLAAPLVDFLYKYYHPHATIMITQASAEVVEGDLGVPFESRD